MGEFLKCECLHCGQPIEFPSDGMGQSVPCPTCGKSVKLGETQREKEWNEWIALNRQLHERQIQSGITPSQEAIPQNVTFQEAIPEAPKQPREHYEMYCPVCGEHIEIQIAAVGKKIACPHCQSEIVPVFFTKIRPKKNRSRFASLTEETIKTKTQTGDTPLHRAAKTGKISEIPRHLLTTELFKIGNYRHETPIEVAAKYGQLDKVPKEFLTPELLSVAVSFYGTVLHHLAYMKMLGFIPDIYANSPMWNLRNTRGQTPRDVLEEVIEQERKQRERKSWVPPRLMLPIQTEPSKLLPAFSDESLRAIQIRATTSTDIYTVNLLDYTCSNPLCKEIHSGVPPRDFGRLCKHIILAMRQKNLVKQLPPIARGIAENGLPYDAYGIYPGRFAEDLYGRPIYITGPNYDGWVSIFALKRRNGVNYYRFGYNIKSKDSLQTMTSTGAAFYRVCPAIDESVLY